MGMKNLFNRIGAGIIAILAIIGAMSLISTPPSPERVVQDIQASNPDSKMTTIYTGFVEGNRFGNSSPYFYVYKLSSAYLEQEYLIVLSDKGGIAIHEVK